MFALGVKSTDITRYLRYEDDDEDAATAGEHDEAAIVTGSSKAIAAATAAVSIPVSVPAVAPAQNIVAFPVPANAPPLQRAPMAYSGTAARSVYDQGQVLRANAGSLQQALRRITPVVSVPRNPAASGLPVASRLGPGMAGLGADETSTADTVKRYALPAALVLAGVVVLRALSKGKKKERSKTTVPRNVFRFG